MRMVICGDSSTMGATTGPKPSTSQDDSALDATTAAALANTVAAPAATGSPAAIALADTVAAEAMGPRVERQGAATIGRFLLLRKLGEGGMGEVFSAFDEQLDRKVAIKVLHAAYAPEETQKRTLREAQALARLAHPNVVAVHEVGQVDGDVFVVMEHIEGTTLLDWQTEQARTAPEVLDAYCSAGRGLAAVHAAGMVHRDFKPHNAMIDREGRVRILDFGLAHARGAVITPATDTNDHAAPGPLASALTAEGSIVGTPAYMSPEQFMGETVDARTDQFSFCVALYEALYGKNPFAKEGSNAMTIPALAAEPTPPPARQDIPTRVADALMRGLSRDRAARFSTMEELLAEIDGIPLMDPSGQTRQRVLLTAVFAMVIGALLLMPSLGVNPATILIDALLPAVVLVVVLAIGTYIFRDTLFRNPFHRRRLIVLFIMNAMIAGSRAAGIKNHEVVESVIMRDTFIAVTGLVLGPVMLEPRVPALWVMSIGSVGGLIALVLWPQYMEIIVTLLLNGAALAFFVAWHQSSKVASRAGSTSV